MSVEHMAVVLHHSRAKGTAKLVLLGIANHAGDGGAWPSVATLARYANVTPRNVQKHIAHLVSLGEVVVLTQAGGLPEKPDYLRPNRYQVTVSCPSWCDRSTQHRDTRPTAGPQRGLHLWKNPLSESTPPVGIDTPPLSESTGDPLSDATPEPSLEPHPPLGSASTTGRARDSRPDSRPCRECGLDQARCWSSQQSWPTEDRHRYRARPRE